MIDNLGRPKPEVLAESTKGVNPEAELEFLTEFVNLRGVWCGPGLNGTRQQVESRLPTHGCR